jgi:hypothetical protein
VVVGGKVVQDRPFGLDGGDVDGGRDALDRVLARVGFVDVGVDEFEPAGQRGVGGVDVAALQHLNVLGQPGQASFQGLGGPAGRQQARAGRAIGRDVFGDRVAEVAQRGGGLAHPRPRLGQVQRKDAGRAPRRFSQDGRKT